MDLEDNYGLAGFKKATSLKYAFPHLKVTIAIGGWNEGSEKYSAMAKNPEARKAFADSVVKFLVEHSFDGLDLDWEYPGKKRRRTDRQTDKRKASLTRNKERHDEKNSRLTDRDG